MINFVGHFCTENKNARFIKVGGTIPISSHSYAIQPLGAYSTGMTIDLIKKCEELKIPYKIDESLFPFLKPDLHINNIEPVPNPNIQYRDYQLEIITKMAKIGYGLFEAPTRSGKSLIIAGLAHNVFLNFDQNKIYNILLLVPTVQLVSQMYNDFVEYGLTKYWNIQRFSSKFPKVEIKKNNVFIVNHKWLMLHGDQLPAIDILFCDEVHQISKRSLIGDIAKSIEIKNKFGCTGSLPDDDINMWYIKGIFGPILHSIEITELQERKILADIILTPIQLCHRRKKIFQIQGETDEERQESAKRIYRQEVSHLISLDSCNSFVTTLAENILKLKPTDNVLILFDYIEHGQRLFELLNNDKKFYIDGTIDVNDRQDVVKQMNNTSGGCITVANAKCFGTGITIKHIQHIIIVNGGKKSTKFLQCIGRGLERNKQHLFVYDIFHNYKYSENHFNERVEKIYHKSYNLQDGINYTIKKISI